MESDEWAVQSNVAEDNLVVCKIVRNVCQRLRICARAMCCLPLDAIIPSDRRPLRKENSGEQDLKFSSTSALSLTDPHKILEDYQNKERGEPSDAENKLKTPDTISCHLLLSQKKITFKDTPTKPVKKLKFETSENMLNHKRSICRLFKSINNKKKNSNDSDGDSSLKRQKVSNRKDYDNASTRSNKSKGSNKSSEYSTKSKRLARISGWHEKKDKKNKRQKARANLAIFSVRCTDNESSGDGPVKEPDENTSSSVVDNRVIGYITREVKKIKLIE